MPAVSAIFSQLHVGFTVDWCRYLPQLTGLTLLGNHLCSTLHQMTLYIHSLPAALQHQHLQHTEECSGGVINEYFMVPKTLPS